MARNRIVYGSQSVWVNGTILYRVQTMGSTTSFTSEDVFELGHLDIIDVVDDVPAVAVTLNTNDWGDVKTLAILAQLAPAKLEMDATADVDNANLISSATYLHGACLADFAVTCGNLPGVSLWAPVQSECDLGTLANNIDQTMFMDAVYINNLEFGYSAGANATENYTAETDEKLWVLNDGRFVNWEESSYTTFSGGSFTLGSGVTIPVFSDGSLGFLRTTDDGARGATYYDADVNTMVNYAVVSGTVAVATTFIYNPASETMYLPTDITPAAGDKVQAIYSANGYVSSMGNKYFEILDTISRPDMIGAVRQGQIEIYIVSDSDSTLDNAWRLTACTVTSALTRTPIAELGHLGPYDRPLTVPVPITLTIDTTAGDLAQWARFADRYGEVATMTDIDITDLMVSDQLKLVVKVFAQTDEEAGGTGANRKIATNSDLIGQDSFNGGTKTTYTVAGEREYALKTIVVEHLKITSEAYTANMGANATQTFGFKSTNDLYVVKGDINLAIIKDGISRNAN